MNENQALIDGLRQAADFMESHPDIGKFNENVTLYSFPASKEELLERTKGIGFKDKQAYGEWFNVNKRFGCVNLQFTVNRELVCEKIVTKKIVPASPEAWIPAKPETEVEEVSWRCPPSLLRGDDSLPVQFVETEDPSENF